MWDTWNDLEGEWEALAIAGKFTTTRTAAVLIQNHKNLRRDLRIMVDVTVSWSDAEEELLLSFAKDRTGIEFASLGQANPAWNYLEREWPGKGFTFFVQLRR